MISRRGLACIAVLALASCAAPGANLPPLETKAPERYRLDSGDQLRVSVFSLPDLPPSYTINDSGWISMPLVGAIPARGKTTEELEETIEQELAKGLVRNPSVSVQVERFGFGLFTFSARSSRLDSIHTFRASPSSPQSP
jgi:polysaccharide export outer membrane protein